MSDEAVSVASDVLADLWQKAGLPMDALQRASLHGAAHGFDSSFAVDVAAQSAIAAAALAATEIDLWRTPDVPPQQVSIDVQHALAETTAYFTLNGERPPIWAAVSGLYACGGSISSDSGQPGHVRIHANFAHHRDGALRLLGLPEGEGTSRAQVQQALQRWSAIDFETQATKAGLVVAAVRTAEEWQASAMHAVIAGQPLVQITRVGDAKPLVWPAKSADQPPLSGLKVLDLTRILAGPVSARTLAAYGADVLMINSPHLPNIESIADMSRGKRSAWLDLKSDAGVQAMRGLLQDAHVFIQGYRPGGLQRLGLGVADVARLRPGIVCGSLSAYGREGPWADKRGFDSLVQTVTGINADEALAFHTSEPRALPMQILDYCAGFLLAFCVQAALLRQAEQGGSWHVEVSLARVAQWLRNMGRRSVDPQSPDVKPLIAPWLETTASGFGELRAVTHAAQLSRTPACYRHPSVPPGTDQPVWI
ncbi:CoA transferase [Diaphorobacter sp. HDW4B]|uniref:CoA transferase n=1 Tax=Diaphorobacter sp. HDW4B TaxID=2714925 RepID=UPI00140A67EA|nr:CoA transferase [Diaphorobacter sp. HDW4B]QIL72569.1 CoA transferase [Diaphorobacter sp. HDW4B]